MSLSSSPALIVPLTSALAYLSTDTESAPSEGDCHIDDLPDEVFAKVLNLVPIRQVIRCAIVSKRWDAACRYIIRTRKSLVIGYDSGYLHHSYKEWAWNWHRERPSQQMDGISLKNKSLISSMMISLNQMEELSRLRVAKCNTRLVNFIPFIRKFSEQLTMLEIDFAVSMIGADSFPHLTRLRCQYFDAKPSAAFPKLEELIVWGLKNEEKLPNMRLPSLKKLLIIQSYRAGDAELVREFILANAATLFVLQMSVIPLRLDSAIVFPNLMKLDCLDVDDAGRCPFPALTHLTITRPPAAEFLNSLPADQMLSLEFCFLYEREDVVSAISKMKKPDQSLVADPCNERFRLAYGFQSDKIRLD